MIKFSRRRADFGSLGEAELDDPSVKPSGAASEGGSMLSSVSAVKDIAAASGDICGCADKDKEAEDKKKKELDAKYPLKDCSINNTPECHEFNELQKARKEEEFQAWKANKDQQVSNNLPPQVKENFGYVNELALELKAMHPEAGNMTLAEIYKRYPDSFDAAYSKLGTKYPILKTLDPQTALAMAPGVSKMTLDELINRTNTLSGGMGSTSSGGSTATTVAAGVGFVALAGGLLWFLRK